MKKLNKRKKDIGLPRGLFYSMIFISMILSIHYSVAQETDFFTSNDKKISKIDFDKKIENLINDIGIPAVSLAIIENNKIVYTKSYGYKNKDKQQNVDINTLFEACSLSKLYLVLAAYKLVDQDLLDLDKPISEYKKNERLEYDLRYKLITPRMILNHTSGIENWGWLNNGDKLEILHDPGTEYTYSGEGFHYLADVIETIVNEPYEEYLDRIVLKPLKLEQVELNYTKNDSLGNYANGHSMIGNTLDKWITNKPWAASSIHTTAKSFSKLLISIFDEKFLSKKSIYNILKPVKVIDEKNKSKYAIGNGIFILENGNDTLVNFSGDNKGFKADMLYSVINKRGFVFFTNSDLGGLFGANLNKLTTNFDADLYFNKPHFKGNKMISNLLSLYNNEGEDRMFEEINSTEEKDLDLYLLEELMFDFYNKDKRITERIAETILRYDSKSASSYFLVGVINLRTHKNPLKAKEYFYKSKNLGFNRYNVDGYIKLCDESIAID